MKVGSLLKLLFLGGGGSVMAGTWRRLRITWLSTQGPLRGAEHQQSSW